MVAWLWALVMPATYFAYYGAYCAATDYCH